MPAGDRPSADLTLTTAGEADLPAIQAICAATLSHHHDAVPGQAALRKIATSPSCVLLVARGDSNAPAGALAASALAWDSAILGMTVARVSLLAVRGAPDEREYVAARLLHRARDEGRGRGWNSLWMRIVADDSALVRGAGAAGADIMGTLVTFRRELDGDAHGATTPAPADAPLRAATPADIHALRSIAARAFRSDRYHCDPAIDGARVDTMWAESVENSVRGRAAQVLVAGEGGDVHGFVTLHLETAFDGESRRGTGVIGLIAVAEGMAGRGFGRALVDGAVDWFRSAGMTAMEVGTQEDNAPALRLYAAAGFHVHAVRRDCRILISAGANVS